MQSYQARTGLLWVALQKIGVYGRFTGLTLSLHSKGVMPLRIVGIAYTSLLRRVLDRMTSPILST